MNSKRDPDLVRIKLGGHGEDDLTSGGIALRQRHQITILEDLIDGRIVDVQLLEPLREQLPDGQIAFEHFAGGWYGELFGAQKTQQEDGIGAALADMRMLLDPLAELGQRLPPYVLVLVQLLLGHQLHCRTQSADIRIVIVAAATGSRSTQLRLLQHLGLKH